MKVLKGIAVAFSSTAIILGSVMIILSIFGIVSTKGIVVDVMSIAMGISSLCLISTIRR
jgi:hypothetical protein